MIKAILFSLFAVGFIFSPLQVVAQPNDPDPSGEEGAKILSGDNPILIPECISDPNKSRTADASCITDSILFYTNILLVVVAIGAFIYMLYGAFLYATAFGDDSKIGMAKKTVTHAIIGIIVAGMSALLVALLKTILDA